MELRLLMVAVYYWHECLRRRGQEMVEFRPKDNERCLASHKEAIVNASIHCIFTTVQKSQGITLKLDVIQSIYCSIIGKFYW
jgi:hypothetical protein